MSGTRRQFLLAAGAGAVGAALSGGAVAVGVEARDHAVTSASDAVREGAGATAMQGSRARLGVHRVVWSTSAEGPYAAITFDDGPTAEYTPRILAALEKAGVRATFSVMGRNAVAHPDLLLEVVAAGHEIANHTWSHLDLTQIGAPRIRTEIARCRTEVEDLVQRRLVGFRPPRGELTGYGLMVAAELGYDVFMWSRTRGPVGTSTPRAVARFLGTTVRAGDVLDLHDGIGRGTFDPTAQFARALAARREVEVRALPDVLRITADRGVVLTTATELLARSAPEPLPSWGEPVAAH